MQTQAIVCRRRKYTEISRLLRSAWAAWVGVAVMTGATVTVAQEPDTPAATAPAPKGEVVALSGNQLLTKDGVALRGVYYPSKIDLKKDAVPVVLLHSHKSSREDLKPLALFLQSEGYAVLVPDLRAHGESKRFGIGAVTRTVDALRQKLGPADFAAMVTQDMEAVKRYLIQENNAGKLNIEKLCLVGTEMGASVALNWAAYDWSWPVYPGLKQGQFAKALVLISPQWMLPGLGVGDAIKSPALHQSISVMILVGKENDKAFQNAKRIHTTLQRSRVAPGVGDPEEEVERKDLFFKSFDTELQGSRLLEVRTDPMIRQFISNFIKLRLVNKDYPWMEIKKKESSAK